MFTGIIEHLGRVSGVARRGRASVLTVSATPPFADLAVGESISVDGVCLTVTATAGSELSFDVVPETLSRSTLGQLKPGDLVNLERSLRLGELVGGHLMLGHVDGVGEIRGLTSAGGQVELAVAVAPELTAQMLVKGSVAVDGISLTLVTVEEERFTVAVIPYTLEHTGLTAKGVGDPVNVETDYLGKWVLQALAQRAPTGVTRDLLERTGFVDGPGPAPSADG